MADYITTDQAQFPDYLRSIPQPVNKLYYRGKLPSERPLVSVVGSRKSTAYGKQSTELIVRQLVRAGVGIVSGLALGTDSWAHRICLENGGYTIAVLPSGIDHVTPRSHQRLAEDILRNGGAIISEYDDNSMAAIKSRLLERNRIVSGLSRAVVIIEAGARSGTMSTARHALEQGREVCAIPGPITAPLSYGTNNLIKAGAQLVTSAEDVLALINVQPDSTPRRRRPRFDNPHQAVVYELLMKDASNDGYELQELSGLPSSDFQQAMTMLELQGHIRPLGNNQWSIK